MPSIVFDIETVGVDLETLDETSQEYFLKFAKTEEEIAEARQSLNFYPVSAQVVAIAILEVESKKGCVYFQNGDGAKEKFTEGDTTYISGTEKDLLAHFWNQLDRYDKIVTFSGRIFDCPFLMVRSAIHGIRSPKNLMPYRYSHNFHVDLADQLCFYDAVRRKFSLHMWCRAFGIESPKEEGISGLQVKDFYKKGQYHDIARYCMRDVVATKQLYAYWEKYLKFNESRY